MLTTGFFFHNSKAAVVESAKSLFLENSKKQKFWVLAAKLISSFNSLRKSDDSLMTEQ